MSEDEPDDEVPGAIPFDDIAHFIVQVRQIVSRDYPRKSDYERAFKRIKNLSNRLYRDHIGYTPEGVYRLKNKYERTFTGGVEGQGGREEVLAELASRNPVLAKILRGQQAGAGAPPSGPDEPPGPLAEAAGRAPAEPPLPPPEDPAMPEWAEEFDPEASKPVAVKGAKTAPLLDLSDFEDEAVELEFEAVDIDE